MVNLTMKIKNVNVVNLTLGYLVCDGVITINQISPRSARPGVTFTQNTHIDTNVAYFYRYLPI